MDLYGTPIDTATEQALTTSGRSGDVHVVISEEEHRSFWNADWDYDDGKDVDAEMDQLGNLWSPAVDQLTGARIRLTRMSCGGGCKCAMAVKLA